MLRAIYLLTIVVFVASTTMGCAQIVRGSMAPVSVNSNPPGAIVQTSTGASCQAPCILPLHRKSNPVMTISMDGYEPASVQLISEFNVGWFLIDFILTGPFVLISFAGGLYDVTPDTVYMTLQPIAGRDDLKPRIVRMSCKPQNDKSQARCDLDEVASIPKRIRR